MKKLTALMLSILIVLSASAALVGATDAAAPAWTTREPDLVITEICPDTSGNGRKFAFVCGDQHARRLGKPCAFSRAVAQRE